jgi:hypothetical protein
MILCFAKVDKAPFGCYHYIIINPDDKNKMFKKVPLLIVLFMLSATMATAEKDCPLGLTDDPAPGQCARYIDNDNDGICDHSQETNQSGGGTAEAQPTENPYNDQPPAEETPASEQAETTTTPPEVSRDSSINESAKGISEQDNSSSTPSEKPEKIPPKAIQDKPNRPNYHPWFLLFFMATLAVFGEIWQKRDPKKLVLIQAVWNWILLLAFLTSSLTGLYFIFPPSAKPAMALSISYWHTITGLIFIYTGMYHAIRRATCLIHGPKTCGKSTPCC